MATEDFKSNIQTATSLNFEPDILAVFPRLEYASKPWYSQC
jgi:hypothetical protein